MHGARGGGQSNVLRGSDLRYDLEITLEDAFNGKEVELQIDSTAACEPCGGSGAKPGTAARTCNMCDGRGQVRRSEEHTSELQSLMRISYAVFCLTNKKHPHHHQQLTQ